MDIHQPLALLGGLSADRFMRRHWQRKPLLVRGAVADLRDIPSRARLLALAGQDDVDSRLIRRVAGNWQLRQGPLSRRAMPPLSERAWTLLVQGVDLHDDATHALMQRFRFVPDARLDDAMISFATDGGGVGPHIDSYDVFLLQVQGRRRWRIGRQRDLRLVDGMPLKILAAFEPQQEFLLEPGDMLYLPPRYAHDGVAVGECVTCSIGFRAPRAGAMAQDLLQRIADDAVDTAGDRLYADPAQDAVTGPAALPSALVDFARDALERALHDRDALPRALGESLTEPKAHLWFDDGAALSKGSGVRLDRRTRMLYDDRHIFINGESWRASGRDARLLRRLADLRRLDAADVNGAGDDVRTLLDSWCETGWAHAAQDDPNAPAAGV